MTQNPGCKEQFLRKPRSKSQTYSQTHEGPKAQKCGPHHSSLRKRKLKPRPNAISHLREQLKPQTATPRVAQYPGNSGDQASSSLGGREKWCSLLGKSLQFS
ncbi:unnamed protein product [Rangifer tarandus platyrhynchus]|uniref:Uncharacterized protein n=1 Tax=Rangifer tarandus platyrhynchus TaxID=3082113 RepID=A0AC60A4Y1_RANTA